MKQLETDIAIVAGGLSGLAAAVAAAELGAGVVILEKASTTGGAANMGMGPFAVESRLQRMRQVPLNREQAFKLFMDYTHWRVDARLVKAYIDKSADTIDWLEKKGVEFADVNTAFVGSNYTWHVVKPDTGLPGPGSAGSMIRILTEKAKELGVRIMLQTPAKKLIKQGDRITGVIAEDNSGEQVQIKAKAVIIATGGFGDSPEMIKKHVGYEWGRDLYSARIPGITGDGIRMAWEAGAASDGLNMELTYAMPFGLPDTGPGGAPWGFAAFRQPNLMVNILGERFMNEEIMGNTTYTGNAISRQKGHCAFNIFDAGTKRHFKDVGLDCLFSIMPRTTIDCLDEDIQQAFDVGYKDVFTADSLDELAEKAGIDAANLKETVEEYNKSCDNGYDGLFHKPHHLLRPVREPKFYAGKFFPSGYGTLGGIKINHKIEVITKDHKPIPGLYASGTDACSIFADSYIFYLPGSTMGFALNSGRMAAENAVKYIRSSDK